MECDNSHPYEIFRASLLRWIFDSKVWELIWQISRIGRISCETGGCSRIED
jgi:hypothetical protein